VRQLGILVVASLIASACFLAPIPPTITGFTPASGTVGAIVTITGANLGEVETAAFDGVSARVITKSDSSVVVKVPDGATSGQLTVRSPAGAGASARHFTVTPGIAAGAEATLPDPTPEPVRIATSTGYSSLSVKIPAGTFGVHLIKERIAEVTVRTVTASRENCRSDCPAKPLADYVRENGAHAAMNGTYLCPPDYAECAGKVNSFDYAVFDTNLGDWINRPALVTQNGLVVFNGKAVKFYRRAHVYAQDRVLSRAPLTAALTMYPLLLLNGNVIDSEREQNAVQKQKATKGAIGVDAEHIYLALVTGATVNDAALVLQALGVRDALNLDGGGTSAMWIGGSYKVGPGRLLPNAIVLTKP
jgi:hypothetical protein